MTLRVACAYQGGKQRVAAQIVDIILSLSEGGDYQYYDLCCGSGAISIELVNRGVNPRNITMLDNSSWGVFWQAVGSETFDLVEFRRLLEEVPQNKREVKNFMEELAARPVANNEAELYPLLQSGSFGGKQLWYGKSGWENAFFRDYWEPTATSIRRSPANPLQPSPQELLRRVAALATGMKGVTGMKSDIGEILASPVQDKAIVYVDPPYRGTTGYGYGFDVMDFARSFRETNRAPLLISEGVALGSTSVRLEFGGAKGGISGARKGRHEEWVTLV